MNQLNFVNYFASLPDDFYSKVTPDPLHNSRLAHSNTQAAKLLGLNEEALNSDAFLQMMAGTQLPEAGCALASVYAGHQFGGYTPRLGDGRALLVGQVRTDKGELWELQLKGSGRTPYSRFGDGRAVLRSTIREYLCSEAMHGLGIPTTRALAIAHSETQVQRETRETAASLLRMAPSHIRFGHFEYFYYQHNHEAVQLLADFVIQHHYPELLTYPEEERYSRWFAAISQRTAELIAKWQAYGFAHGVMNTDNMSILGLTIDYGPFAFLDDFDPGLICNHSDHTGRYAFNQQVSIGLWNLNALANALSNLIPVEDLRQILSRYEGQLINHYRSLMRSRFGLAEKDKTDDPIISDFLQLLKAEKADYSFMLRKLCEVEEKPDALRDHFVNRDAFDQWQLQYMQRLQKETQSPQSRKQQMLDANPKYILRNYLAQEAIELAEKGDYRRIDELLTVLQQPFAEHPQFEHFARLPPDWGKNLEISCSS